MQASRVWDLLFSSFCFIHLHRLPYRVRFGQLNTTRRDTSYAMNSYGMGARAIGTGGLRNNTPMRGCLG